MVNKVTDSTLGDSSFLEKFYGCLTKVESSNREALAAKEELKWYEAQLVRADTLSRQLGFDNALDIPSDRPSFSQNMKDQASRMMQSAESKVSEFQRIKTQAKLRLQELVTDFESAIRNMEKEINIYIQSISDYETRIEELKDRRLKVALILISTPVVTVFIFPNIIAVVIAVVIMYAILAYQE